MPSKEKALNIRAMPARLMREIKAAASRRGVTVKDFVIEVMGEKVGITEKLPAVEEEKPRSRFLEPLKEPLANTIDGQEPMPGDPVQVVEMETVAEVSSQSTFGRPKHDPKTCAVYGCGMCAVLKGEK